MSYTVEEIAQLNESMESAILSIKAANNILEEMMATGRIYVEDEHKHIWECSDIPGYYYCNLCPAKGSWNTNSKEIVEE